MNFKGCEREKEVVSDLQILADEGFLVSIRKTRTGRYKAILAMRGTTGMGETVTSAVEKLVNELKAEGYWDE